MALQPTSMTHQAYAQFWGHDAKDKKEEKSVGAKSAFIMGNYHSKPLMTDVIVIHKVKKNMAFHPRSMTHLAYPNFGDILCPPAKKPT